MLSASDLIRACSACALRWVLRAPVPHVSPQGSGRRGILITRKKEVSSLMLPYPRQTTTRKGGIYEPGKVDNNSDRCVLYGRALHDAANTKSAGPACWRRETHADLQPVPAWDPPVRFRFGNRKGAA